MLIFFAMNAKGQYTLKPSKAGLAIAGIDVVIADSGTVAEDHAALLQSAFTKNSTNTLTNLYNNYGIATINSGTVTNRYQSYMADATGSGTVTNQYGYYAASLTKGSYNRAFYAAGTTASYLGGNTYFGNKVGVNATDGATLTLPLTIWNNASGDAGLRIAQTGQNNWDFYNPTGQTYLGLRDVNGGTPYMTWLNGGNIGINTITPNSRFQINGSFAETLTAISASSTTVNANHDIFTCNANSNAQTFTVPTAVGITGRAYRFIKTDASANTVSIASTSSQTFSGPYYSSSTSYVLYNQGEEVTMRSDGANWVIESIMKGGLTTSSAGTLTLSYGKDYIFTGTTTTWTLPAVASTVFGRPNAITIKNQGSGAITLNTSGGGSDLYTDTSGNTITINAGESAFLLPDGTKINVE